MKVIDFTNDDFLLLNENIHSKCSCTDDILVIGIANGGIPFQNNFCSYLFGKNIPVHNATLKCQRPSTSKKNEKKLLSNLFRFLLKVLPKTILNFLRIIEHNILSKRGEKNNKREVYWVNKPIKNSYNTIVIIDDAIDSGHSFLMVNKYIDENITFENKITAVAVCTQNDPVYTPDVFLHKNVLIRFPWSLDAKK